MPAPQIEPPEELRNRRRTSRRATRHHRYQAAGLITLLILSVGVVLLGDIWGVQSGNVPSQSQGTPGHTPSAHGASDLLARARDTPSASRTSHGGAGHPGAVAVPILMYHVIAAPPPGAPFPGLYVAPAEFSEQMQALKGAGWHAVTLDQVEAYWRRGAPLGPGKPIVLSFDNGYQSQYTQALPVLQRLGWVGVENIQLTGLPPSQGGFGQGQVRGLIDAGWELDTQGFSHADLIKLDAEQLHYQVAVARRTLQQRYNVPVNWFCYPSGHYDATVIAEVRAAGYAGSTTVVPGWAHAGDDAYRLHRLRVLGGTSPAALLAQIASTREDPPAPASYNGA
ncbi:MAG TPA: polysaccharide deacetylase family protein [Solirubrobacteraceae bacterium]